MRRSLVWSALFSSGMAIVACQMPNPAFEDGVDSVADDSGSDEDTGESNESESGTGTSSTDDATSSTDDATGSSEVTTDDATGSSEVTTDDATSETGTDCMDGQTMCDGICFDLHTDPLNCGVCGMICADNQACVNSGCTQLKRVFVTSVPLSANLGGIQTADQFCNLLAANAQLGGTYKAWLSTPNSVPAQAFTKVGAYGRTDGVLVAKTWPDLVDGQLDAPINADQTGAPVSSNEGCGATTMVWSATTADGLFAGDPNCNNWTSNTIGAQGRVGDAWATDGKWSNVGDCFINCAAPLPVYCIEQ